MPRHPNFYLLHRGRPAFPLLTRSRGLRLIDLERPLLRIAAQLRAKLSLKPPDAIQMAAALVAGCSAFLTNDRNIPSTQGLRILQLSDYF
ncbi:MAG TPA: PIN domain-containing protein [Methylomirabilota bacterium]|nr:PIN domain-containing protein [Methylomirabilota bacterium]